MYQHTHLKSFKHELLRDNNSTGLQLIYQLLLLQRLVLLIHLQYSAPTLLGQHNSMIATLSLNTPTSSITSSSHILPITSSPILSFDYHLYNNTRVTMTMCVTLINVHELMKCPQT
jgi:hypothetical protein